MDKSTIDQLAKELYEGSMTGKPVQHLTKRYEDMKIEDSYAILMAGRALREEAGDPVIGAKIGLTSKAMQEAFGLYEPDYGYMTASMMAMEGEVLDLSSMRLPKVETEIAFKLKEDLVGPGINASDVLKATEGVMASFEIIDTRYENWDIQILDSIADIASISKVILGGKMVPVEDFDLRHVGLVVEKNGEVLDTAAGAVVLGNPANSVAWLANKLSSFGTHLKAGDLVISGSLTKPYEVESGDVFKATFDRLGSVQVKFK